MNNSKEVVKKIKNIFERIKSSCYIDSLTRIDENTYNCHNCVLADTKDVKRDDILGREICPLEVKGDVYALRREDKLGKGMYPICPLEVKGDIRVLK